MSDWRAAIREFANRLDLQHQVAPYAPYRFSGVDDERPVLHLDDVSAIPFLVDIAGVELYQHRARLRADSGAIFATVTPASEGYEDYCRDLLRLGEPSLVVAEPVGTPLAVARACRNGDAFANLVDRARASGGMIIHPYMSIEEVWSLAADIQREAGSEVSVIGPAPPVTWIANDKALFSDVVSRTVGSDHLVETHLSADADEMAKLLIELSGRHHAVGLKRTRCASAMGNAVWDAAELRSRRLEPVAAEVRAFLARTEWPGDEEVLVVAWEQTELSPSTQLWLPPTGHGPPRLDGIYEQILTGEERVFVGSRPSTLPAAVNNEIARLALEVATALQELGYIGRCSFDHLVVGDIDGDFQVLFTESNGRWGGTSTPMSLIDRLMPGDRPPYRAQDVVSPDLIGATLPELLAKVGDDVYDPSTGEGTFIFYNVGPLADSGKLDVIALGKTQDDAERAMTETLPALLGIAFDADGH